MRADRQTKLICVFGEYENAQDELDEKWKEAVVAWCEVLPVFTLRDSEKQ